MNELYERFNALMQEGKENTDKILDLIAKKRQSIKRLEKQIEKLETKCYCYPSWIKTVLTPLAQKLSEKIGMPYEIYGPFGLANETSVYFHKDMTKSICDQPTKHLTVVPEFNGDKFYLKYYTGEKTNKYQSGSIGELNGYNNCRAVLPDDFNEILKIVNKNNKEND